MSYQNQERKKQQVRNINQENTTSSTPISQRYADNRPEMQSAAQLYAAIRANTIANRPSYMAAPNTPKQRQVHPMFQNRGTSPVQRKKQASSDFHIQMAKDEMAKAPVTQRFEVPAVSDDEDTIQRKPANIDRTYYMNSNHQGNPIDAEADRTGLLPGSIQGIRDTYILREETIGGHLYKREWGGADDFSNVVNWTPTEEGEYTEAENTSVAIIRAYAQALHSRARMRARERAGEARNMNDRSSFHVKAKFKSQSIDALGNQIISHEQDSDNRVKWDFLTYIKYALETFADRASMNFETRLNPDSSGIDITPEQAGGYETTFNSGIINGPNISPESLDRDQIQTQYENLVTNRDMYIQRHQNSIDQMKTARIMPRGFRIREAVPPEQEEQPTTNTTRPFGRKNKKGKNKLRR